MKVLVVDDSVAIGVRLAAMLAEVRGVLEVLHAANAAQALEAARARRPDLVVLDVRMPGGSGLEALPMLKALAGPPVVVILTNHPTEHHRRLAMGLGADHFFDKSTEFARVCDVVRSLLADRPG